MTSAAELFRVLQQADSFFPSGGLSFSWGLERLVIDGAVRAEDDVARFLESQLRHRWASSDRVALAAAHVAGGALDQVARIDHAVEVAALPALIRDGSRRAGRALLSVHVKLAAPHAKAYQLRVTDGAAEGHLPVVQGMLWSSLGLSLEEASTAAAYAFAVSVLSAALRLGVIGHFGAQRLLTDCRRTVAEILEVPPPPIEALGAYAPLAEIGAMRHETAAPRLFVN